MTSRTTWSTLGTILLPVCVLLAYAAVTLIGFIWPEKATLSMIAAIAVSIALFTISGWWFRSRTGCWTWVAIVLMGGALVFPMVGSANLGTDLALEQQADAVSGTVADIDVEQTNHQKGEESWKTTYTFVATDVAARELGTVDYRGGRDAYELQVGDTTDLLVDPAGELPVKLAEEVDSGTDIGMLAIGGVLYLIVYAIGLVWPVVRRAFR